MLNPGTSPPYCQGTGGLEGDQAPARWRSGRAKTNKSSCDQSISFQWNNSPSGNTNRLSGCLTCKQAYPRECRHMQGHPLLTSSQLPFSLQAPRVRSYPGPQAPYFNDSSIAEKISCQPNGSFRCSQKWRGLCLWRSELFHSAQCL